MKRSKLRRRPIIAILISVTALMLGSTSFAETVHFRVAFEAVPGLEDIEAGDIPAGIKVLRYALDQTAEKDSGDLLATLCAAYIINDSLRQAKRICNKAVNVGATQTAYNNRGVYRALTGDLAGAREDFQRIRPRHLEAYLEELKTRDVPLMAIDNADLIERLAATYTAVEINASIEAHDTMVQSIVD